MWALLGIPAGAYYCCVSPSKNRKKRIDDIMDVFEYMNNSNICTLDETEKENLRDWFMGQKWHMQYQLKSQNKNEKVEVTLKDISNRTDISYNIKMSMKDAIGGSDVTGVLAIKGDHLKMKLEKTYYNRESAGQTGNYDILLYEGEQEG